LIIIPLILIPIISFLLGILFSYEIRKIFARAQFRLGPLTSMYSELKPLLGTSRLIQPLYDILKLLYKESIIPKSANKTLFKISPWISFLLIFIASYFISYGGFTLLGNFELNIIFLIYLIVGVTLFWLIGAVASGSPWSEVGVRREAELMFTVEVTLVSSIFSIAILSNSLSIQKIVNHQLNSIPYIILNPIAAIAFIIGLLGKLHLKPFDIPDAEVEIVAGPFTEYSGKYLALLYTSKYFLTSILIGLFVDLFLAGGQILPPINPVNKIINFITFIILCLIMTFIISIINALAPRFRIDQAFKWMITRVWPISVLSIILSLIFVYIGVI